MHLVALGWIYVVMMMAVAEALSPQGTVLGAVITFLMYGVMPLSVVLYILGTPGRKRLLAEAEAREALQLQEAALQQEALQQPVAPQEQRSTAASGTPDGGDHAPGDPVAPVRKEV